MILSHNELLRIVEQEIITPVDPKDINAASIDIHLGNTILWEDAEPGTIDFSKRDPVKFNEYVMDENGYLLKPGDFILAQSREVFNLPHWLSAEYKLKSSMARIGLEHMNAGWCDAGWNGSVLTLELKNMTKHHAIRIRPGDPIGQMVFFKHEPVAARGMDSWHYDGDCVPSDVLGRLGDDAMNVTYEIRTSRNARVFAYDSLARAKEERIRAEKRIGCKMQIIKITHMEEILHD